MIAHMPTGKKQEPYEDLAKQNHILIAGQTGSGKSVVINSFIRHLLIANAPFEAKLILIDPKLVELYDYRQIPHCLKYASEPADMVNAILQALDIVQDRYKDMQARRLKKFDGSHIYIIIDELADLMSIDAKHVTPPLIRISQIGRAANVHLILATQHLLSTGNNGAAGIDGRIQRNITATIGLKTHTRRDSMQIIGAPGCEALPAHGFCLYARPGHDIEKLPIRYLGEEGEQAETDRLVSWWMDPAHYRRA